MTWISWYYMLQHTFKKIFDDRLNKLFKKEHTGKIHEYFQNLSFRKISRMLKI